MLCQSWSSNAIQPPGTLPRRLILYCADKLSIHNANSSQETLNWGGREGWYRKSPRSPRSVPLFHMHQRITGLFLGKTDFSLSYSSSSSWHSCPEKYSPFQLFSGSSGKWGHLSGVSQGVQNLQVAKKQQPCTTMWVNKQFGPEPWHRSNHKEKFAFLEVQIFLLSTEKRKLFSHDKNLKAGPTWELSHKNIFLVSGKSPTASLCSCKMHF